MNESLLVILLIVVDHEGYLDDYFNGMLKLSKLSYEDIS